ncbi:hypothetical protein HDV00_012787, partial [Rhizophlyctis rosea]
MTTNTEETSLKQYLLDAKVDPVQEQLNLIHLDIIRALDRDRITDRTRYNLQQVIRSGQYTGWKVPRIPEPGKIDEKFAPSNLPPYSMRVGQEAYQRFTFKHLYNVPNLPQGQLTFNVHKPDDVFLKAVLHKHDVSVKDQRALDEVRKKQLGEEIDKIRKLEQSRSKENEHVGVVDQTHMNNIARLANPLQVFTTPNENTVMQAINTAPSVPVLREAERSNFSKAIEASHHSRNLGKFEAGQPARHTALQRAGFGGHTTIAERRMKGKGAVLTIDTSVGRSNYDTSTWTHPAHQYVISGQSGGFNAAIFDDRNVASLQPFVDRFEKYPPGFGETARRLNILQASSPLASHGTRKANVVYGQRKRSKSNPDPRLNPIVSDVALEVAREIKEEQAKPNRLASPISQGKAIFSRKIGTMVGRKKHGKFTEDLKKKVFKAFYEDYKGAISPTSMETLEHATKTNDLIKSLVEKYAGKKNDDLKGDLPEDMPGAERPIPEGMPDDSIVKPKRKRKITEKQLEHLKKTREIAVEKRKEYAAKRREEKEQAEREEYENKIDQIADKKLKDKLLKALEEQ